MARAKRLQTIRGGRQPYSQSVSGFSHMPASREERRAIERAERKAMKREGLDVCYCTGPKDGHDPVMDHCVKCGVRLRDSDDIINWLGHGQHRNCEVAKQNG